MLNSRHFKQNSTAKHEGQLITAGLSLLAIMELTGYPQDTLGKTQG